MSTRKDATKTSTSNLSKKKVATKTSTRREESTDRSNAKRAGILQKTKSKTEPKKRDESTDRINVKKTGIQHKAKNTGGNSNLVENKTVGEKDKVKVKEKNVKVQSTPHERQVSTRKNIKPKVPVTPPSNRVSKTQYFPSKSLYTNALRADESIKEKSTNNDLKLKEKVPQKRLTSKVTTSSKDMVKKTSISRGKSKPTALRATNSYHNSDRDIIQFRDISPDSSSISERPRTATLRKGSIVNANIVGPDVPKQLVPKKIRKEVLKIDSPSNSSEASGDYNYEDDFESYESDFEEYFSSSSNNLDDISGEETSSVSSTTSSNNVDLKRSTSDQKRITSAGTDDERKLDSGNFDMSEIRHKQVLDNIKESIEKENANLKIEEAQRNNPASLSDEGFEDQKSLQFINFLDAKKKCEHRKSMEMKRKRGEDILNMIRLDTYSFTLFELAPVPYETFIKNYGRSNTLQTLSQTGEDNVDEELQTEEITSVNRWTQFPACFSKINIDDPNYWEVYKNDYLGVGGDVIVKSKIDNKSYNENSLSKFLLSAGDLILKIQAESNFENVGRMQKNSREVPFSKGYILFNTTTDIFKDCAVKCFSFSSDNSKIITVHSKKGQDTEEFRSVLCVWTTTNSEEPEEYFISYSDISCCCFGLDYSDFIFAGLNDGNISIWDLKKKIYNEDSLLKRTPLFTTEIDSGHISKIVSLQPFTNYAESLGCFQSNQTNEICSLDEEGDIIVWSVIMKNISRTYNPLNNSTNWNDVVLAKNTKIMLKRIHPELEDLQCTDFVVNTMNSNYVLVSTNYGFIIHHLIKGGRSSIKKFMPESSSIANCIEVCPFSSNYLLAGFDDGNISLYSRLVEKPIMVLSDKEEGFRNNGIQMIQWSRNKPFVIYAKDVNNTIHIWDLNESDIYPIYSVPFNENITYFKLSSLLMDDDENTSYMMIGTDNGKMYLHILNSEHGPQPGRIYKEHVNTFLKYVNRL